MVSDSPLSAEEKESLINWRQELRDITDYEGDVYDVVIPICPIASLPNTNYPNERTLNITAVLEMNGSSDYVELYARANVISGVPVFETVATISNFGAYRIGS